MPLCKSKSKKCRNKNIKQLIKEGYPAKQATAIAYDIQRKKKKRKK